MNRMTAWLCTSALTLLGGISVSTAHAAEPSKEGIEFFETKIRPVLVESCYQCHSAEAKTNKKLKSKFYADSMEGLTKGGDTGNPGIVPGDPDKSSVIKSIRYQYKDDDDTMNMPPKKGDKGGKLPDEVIKNFEKWVKMGAPAPAEFQKPKEAKADAGTGTSPQATAADPKASSAKDHWAFGPPALSPVPSVKNTAWAKTEIDRFVLAKLEAKGLQPADQADRRTLIRRATFGLLGLPPTPEEVEAFVADTSPNAYEKLVDRLLADSRYGERWARHWLDVARYSDTKGYVFQEERRYPYAYTYRDYVIRAFNEDKPYDRFLIEQIAADKLDLGNDKSPLAAMGFLTVGRRFLNRQEDIIDDRIDVVTRGTMGLTVACARCHDHKFEPIPTRDYYSLYGVFASSVEPDALPLIGDAKGSPEFEKELAKRQAEVDAFLVKLRDELVAKARTPKGLADYLLATLEPDRRGGSDNPDISRALLSKLQVSLSASAQKKDPIFAAWRLYAAVKPDEFTAKSQVVTDRIAKAADIHPLVKAAFKENPKSLREVAERYGALLAKFDKPEPLKDAEEEAIRQVLRGEQSLLAVSTSELERGLRRDQRNKHRELQKKVEQFQATSPDAPPRAMVMNDGNPHDVPIFIRGNSANRGVIAPRQFLEILSGPERKKFSNGSGRLELAEAIASKSNPLTARVMVNRVWAWHFGTGIVTTPSDFGLRSDPPSHREMLDWMAVTFMNDGWSIKKLQKRILMSAVYQQASDDNPAARAIDPENRLLWRQNRKRLEFEAIRDSMLAASGQLHQSLFGRPVDINRAEENRRTIYGFIDRQNLPSMFRSFDFASPDMHTPQRLGTTVPQQALFFLNSPFAQRQAKMLVQREDVKSRATVPEKVTRIYQLLFGRPPTPNELAMAQQFMDAEPASAEQPAVSRPIWSYGYGKVDPAAKKTTSFTPLPTYSKRYGWSGSAKLPDAKLGFVYISDKGGHAGEDGKAAIRRWTAPAAGTIEITGELIHSSDNGDGVRGLTVSSRHGVVAQWQVRNGKIAAAVKDVQVEAGDTIDFVVECGGDTSYDGFQWAPVIVLTGPKVPGGSRKFDAAAEFSGTREAPAPVERLSAWEKYVQVLMSSNEFVFVD